MAKQTQQKTDLTPSRVRNEAATLLDLYGFKSSDLTLLGLSGMSMFSNATQNPLALAVTTKKFGKVELSVPGFQAAGSTVDIHYSAGRRRHHVQLSSGPDPKSGVDQLQLREIDQVVKATIEQLQTENRIPVMEVAVDTLRICEKYQTKPKANKKTVHSGLPDFVGCSEPSTSKASCNTPSFGTVSLEADGYVFKISSQKGKAKSVELLDLRMKVLYSAEGNLPKAKAALAEVREVFAVRKK